MTEPESVQEEMQEAIAPMDAVLEQEPTQEVEAVQEQEQEQTVPLSALQKERKKRQDWEQRAKLYEQQQAAQLAQRTPVAEEEDEDQYEALTKAEAKKRFQSSEQKIVQTVTESIWAKENPEKIAEVNENLAEFLNQRQHLKLAIEAAPNRYEEAWTLMNALSPKQKASLKPQTPVKKAAPGSPNGIPKAAGINQVVDLSSMSDSEFNAWRATKRAGRR